MKKAARVACCWARGDEGVMRDAKLQGTFMKTFSGRIGKCHA